MTRRLALAAALLAGALQATAAEPAGPEVKRLREGTVVRMERLLDDPAWRGAPVFDAFVERLPVNGAVPSERTTLRVLVGPRALYVGVRAEDHAPADADEGALEDAHAGRPVDQRADLRAPEAHPEGIEAGDQPD